MTFELDTRMNDHHRIIVVARVCHKNLARAPYSTFHFTPTTAIASWWHDRSETVRRKLKEFSSINISILRGQNVRDMILEKFA